jgi:hypothetical protein
LYAISSTNSESLLFSSITVIVVEGSTPITPDVIPEEEEEDITISCAETEFINLDKELKIDNYKVSI